MPPAHRYHELRQGMLFRLAGSWAASDHLPQLRCTMIGSGVDPSSASMPSSSYGPGGLLTADAALNPVPILLYHAISADPPNWIAPFAVSPAIFSAHLDVVMSCGRQALTISEYVDGLYGNTILPPRPVLITVDDGFADFADNALPALAERKLPSTLYVTTGALADLDKECVLPPADMLRSGDLSGLETAGVEIGAHSHTHRQLDLMPRRAVAAELSRSGTLLAEILGHRIRSFAYPHGYWTAGIKRLVGQAGFDSACAVGEALSSTRDHPLALSRLLVRADTDVSTITAWMEESGARVLSRRHRVLTFGWRQYRRVRHVGMVPGEGSWSNWQRSRRKGVGTIVSDPVCQKTKLSLLAGIDNLRWGFVKMHIDAEVRDQPRLEQALLHTTLLSAEEVNRTLAAPPFHPKE
jgi:peptidoglycan/xylan/chitin deacetylase (PgdA/CDA1 family)